jgi:hypothetical protein
MHLLARAALLALIPSLAAAQSESPYPARQQGAPVSAAPARARVLVLECPAPASQLPAPLTETDSETRALVTELCARAQATPATPAAPAASVVVAPQEDGPPIADPLGPPESALALLMRLAERPEWGYVVDTAAAPAKPLPAPPSAHPAPAHDEHFEHGEEGSAEPGAEEAGPFEPQLKIHLVADIKYSAVDTTGSRNGFALGQFDLFGRSQLSDALSVITEATLTALPRNTYSARLERLLFTFAPNDWIAASVGRYHTGIGYYNTAYHHGTWFQTATGRPLIFAIDGDIGLIPIHTVGVSVTGEVPSGALGLRYIGEVGSGRAGQSSAAIAPQPALADNNSLSVNVGLFARPTWLDGLQFGGSLYRNRLTMQDVALAPIAETIAGAHALYRTETNELLGEALLVRHSPRGGASDDIRGYYALASHRFGSVRPYARFDYVDVPASDPVFAFLGRRTGPTFGVRYDFDALAALKLQAGHLNQTTRPTMNRFEAQVSFMF